MMLKCPEKDDWIKIIKLLYHNEMTFSSESYLKIHLLSFYFLCTHNTRIIFPLYCRKDWRYFHWKREKEGKIKIESFQVENRREHINGNFFNKTQFEKSKGQSPGITSKRGVFYFIFYLRGQAPVSSKLGNREQY